MNILADELIQEECQKVYDKYINIYGSSRMLGVFPIGLANYGLAETLDELQFTIVYVPNFEDICTGIREFPHTDNIYTIDIRQCYDINNDISRNTLELLATEYSIINPKYKKIFDEQFLANIETICKYNPYKRVSYAYEKAQKAVENGDNFTALRLRIASEKYLFGKDIRKCFKPDDTIHQQYLWATKNGFIPIKIEEVMQEFKTLVGEAELSTCYDSSHLVKQGVVNILKCSFEDSIDVDTFYESLTRNEKEVFEYLKEQTKTSNLISVSVATEELNISRPVFTNLFKKMKESKIADITNKGVRGTQIDWKV